MVVPSEALSPVKPSAKIQQTDNQTSDSPPSSPVPDDVESVRSRFKRLCRLSGEIEKSILLGEKSESESDD